MARKAGHLHNSLIINILQGTEGSTSTTYLTALRSHAVMYSQASRGGQSYRFDFEFQKIIG